MDKDKRRAKWERKRSYKNKQKKNNYKKQIKKLDRLGSDDYFSEYVRG